MQGAVVRVFLVTLLMTLAGVVVSVGCGVEEARESGERAAGNESGSEERSRSGESSEAGSGGTEQTVQEATSEQATVPETTGSPAGATESTSAMEGTSGTTSGSTSESARVLEDKWYIDSDSNEVPDFIEVELGYEPKADDCAKKVNCPGPSGASGTSAVDFVSKEQNTLLILDSSGSMAESLGDGQIKMDAARDSLERYATATPDFINLGFMVYGHKGSNSKADRTKSCQSTELLEPLGKVDYKSFPDTLESFQPTGWTPIADALEKAGETFSGKVDAMNRVILVSDGLETCGGDPVAAAQELADSDVQVTIDVVGFDIPQSEEEQLRQIAEVSGGNYATVSNAEELQDYFDEQRKVRDELVDQWACVYAARNDLHSCTWDFGRYTRARMYDLYNDAFSYEDGPERAKAIEEIHNRSELYNERLLEEVDEQGDKRLDEIDEDMDEVEKRMEERYNEDISFAPSCPKSTVYASLAIEDVPDAVTATLLTSDLSD